MSDPLPSVWSVHRTLPSDTSVAADFCVELVDAMTHRNWPPRDIFRVQLAFDEAIVNAIRHGNRFDANKNVEVDVTCNGDQVHICIADQGNGFDPSKVPDPRSDELLEVPGGRGVLLISELMNEVHYNDRGNEVKMTKYRSDPDADEDEDDDE